MKFVSRTLLGLHIFVGIGAMFGGIAAILNPTQPLGMPATELANSPFQNYLIPGLILLTVMGFGNLFSALTFLKKSKYQGYISSVFSWALVIWILVQCIMLQAVAFLHVLFFFIGLLQAFLSFLLLLERNQFPANIVLFLYKKITRVL